VNLVGRQEKILRNVACISDVSGLNRWLENQENRETCLEKNVEEELRIRCADRLRSRMPASWCIGSGGAHRRRESAIAAYSLPTVPACVPTNQIQ